MDAADLCRGDDRDVGLFFGEKPGDRGLIRQIQFTAGALHQRNTRLAGEAPHQRGTDHALMSGDKELHGGSG
jgi:hypothetical protein